MDQGIISTFKAYFIRWVFSSAIDATTGGDSISLQEFWKSFNIKHAIENISLSWEEVTPKWLNGCWKKLLPECTIDFPGFETPVKNVIEEIALIGKDLGFENVDEENIQELLNSHSADMDDVSLIELEQQQALQEKYEDDCEEVVKEITIKELEDLFQDMEKVKRRLMDIDPDVNRSMKVCRSLDQLSCYRKIYFEKKQNLFN